MLEVLDLTNYNLDNPTESIFCTAVENCGKGFASLVAKGERTEEDVESFVAILPIADTERKKVTNNRVKADINDALIKRDKYLEQTQSIPLNVINGGRQKNYQKQAQPEFRVFEGENEKGLSKAA